MLRHAKALGSKHQSTTQHARQVTAVHDAELTTEGRHQPLSTRCAFFLRCIMLNYLSGNTFFFSCSNSDAVKALLKMPDADGV